MTNDDKNNGGLIQIKTREDVCPTKKLDLATVRENGTYLESRLQGLSSELKLGEVRGRGLLLALELGREIGSHLVDAALVRGLLMNSPRPAVLRFMPALNVSRAEIDEMIRILREAIESVG